MAQKFENVKNPGKYQKDYESKPKPGRSSTRTVRMSNNGSLGAQGALVSLDWDPDGIAADLENAIRGALGPVLQKMAEEAKRLVHITGGQHGSSRVEHYTRKDGSEGTRYNPRDPRPAYKTGPHSGKEYTSRDPGRLAATILSKVVIRNDRTAIIGYLQAGDENADYAFVEELGVPGVAGGKREGHAFLRPAFNKYADDAIQEIEKAVGSL
jgi:hypothetical protein